MPYVSRIVKVDGKKYLDGGCTDSIPVDAFREMGYTKNVVILTRPADHVRQPEHRTKARLFYPRYKSFIKALLAHHERYNATQRRIRELEEQGEIFVIRPYCDLNIGRLENDPQSIQRVYEQGRADAEAAMDKLTEWIKNVYEKNTYNS